MIDEEEYAELESQLDECHSEIDTLECRIDDLESQLDDMYGENQSLLEEIDDLSEVQKYDALANSLLEFYRAVKNGESTYSAEIDVQTHLSSMDILV